MKENVENFRCKVCGGTSAGEIAGYCVCNICGNAERVKTDVEQGDRRLVCEHLVKIARSFGLDAEVRHGYRDRYILRKVGQESPAFIVSLEEPMEIFQRKCERLKEDRK